MKHTKQDHAEIERLKAEIERLRLWEAAYKEERKNLFSEADVAATEIERLTALNAELVAVLTECADRIPDWATKVNSDLIKRAFAALAKVKEGK